jgi:hypothetical protein
MFSLVTALTLVPALKIAPRAPFGPSLVLKAGIPFAGMALDLQKSAATRRETYESLLVVEFTLNREGMKMAHLFLK